MFTPVSTGRVSEDIVEQVLVAIRDGRLVPGDQLPPERELTRQLGVSRVSVRDALRTLGALGLIDVRVGARGGAFVTAPAPSLVGEGISHMLMLADVSPRDLTEARTVFELAILDLACRNADADDVADLVAICDRADAAIAAGAYDPTISAEFHTRLAACTHNRALALVAETLQGPLAASLREARRADPSAGTIGALEHRAIVDAIRSRDAETARAVMRAHLDRTARRVATA